MRKDSVAILVRVPPELAMSLKQAAKLSDRSLSSMVRRLIRESLANWLVENARTEISPHADKAR